MIPGAFVEVVDYCFDGTDRDTDVECFVDVANEKPGNPDREREHEHSINEGFQDDA